MSKVGKTVSSDVIFMVVLNRNITKKHPKGIRDSGILAIRGVRDPNLKVHPSASILMIAEKDILKSIVN